MATGFAAGLARGLQTGEELSIRRAQEDRQAAIQTANLGMAMEDQAFKREERDRAKAMREEMSQLWGSTYGAKEIEVEEPVPGAIPTDSGTSADMVQKVKKQIMVAPGERTPEGRQRDLDFFNRMTAVRAKYSDFTPEQIKQSMEYGRFLEKEGIEDGLMKLMTSGDASGLAPLAQRLGVDPKSLKVESDGKAGYPKFTLTGVTADGKPVAQDLEPILTTIGLKSFSEATDKGINRKKAIVETNLAEAKIENTKADTSYTSARTGEVGASKVNTAQKDFLPKMPPGADKPVIDPGAGTARQLLRGISGGSNAKADDAANRALARISAAAQERVDAEEKSSGKKLSVSAYNERYQAIRNQLVNDFVEQQKRQSKNKQNQAE